MSNVIKLGPTPTVRGLTFGVPGHLQTPVIAATTIMPGPRKLKLKASSPINVALVAKAASSGKLVRKKKGL